MGFLILLQASDDAINLSAKHDADAMGGVGGRDCFPIVTWKITKVLLLMF
jgi:hypothetical protein